MFKVAKHKGNRLTIDTNWMSFNVYITLSQRGLYVQKNKDMYIREPEWNEIVRIAIDYWNKLEHAELEYVD